MPIVAFVCVGILIVAWTVAPQAARARAPLAVPASEAAVPAAA